MKAEIQKIINLFEELEEASETAFLTLSTKGGKTTIKLQLESPPSPSPPSISNVQTLQPASGRRRRHRGARARARRNQRAAAHQTSNAEAATSALLDPPPSPIWMEVPSFSTTFPSPTRLCQTSRLPLDLLLLHHFPILYNQNPVLLLCHPLASLILTLCCHCTGNCP